MKVSYCTNCHNRLWQLQQTLPHNLKFTKIDEIEIVVLAYNDDSIKPYLEENYKEYLSDGRLNVYNHNDDLPYTFAHVKNLTHGLAKGEILFNLDSDNYIDGVENILPTITDNQLMITDKPLRDGRGGRIGMTRNTFNRLNGYRDNQRLPDDDDLIFRAMALGKILVKAPCLLVPIANT